MKIRYIIALTSGLLIVVLFGCARTGPAPEAPGPPAPPQQEYEIKTDPSGVKYIVEPEKLVVGGPPKDGIPSIDNPKFVSLEEADRWIEDNELVLAIDYKMVKRVYPLQILVWHEIVNDVIAGDPLLITY